MIKLLNKLVGVCRITAEASGSAAIVNLLHAKSIDVYSPGFDESGAFTFEVLQKDFEFVRKLLDKNGFRVYSVYREGFPIIYSRYKKRAGMFVGALIFVLLLYASTLFVWNVEVVTPSEADHTEIINDLQTLGFGVGTFLPKCDLEGICYRYLDSFDNVSWMAINVKGTSARIEVRDIVRSDHSDDDGEPANIVASDDALIESYSVYGGVSAVTPGQVVRAGELLISGVVDDKQGVLHLCRASGEVMGRVGITLTSEIDRISTEEYFESSTVCERYISLFGKRIMIYKNRDINVGEYPERTKDSSSLVLFDTVELPLTLETVKHCKTAKKTVRRTDEEMHVLAEQDMAEQIDALGADIISIESNETDNGDRYTLTCRVECIKNIAEVRKIGVSGENDE